MPKLPNETYAEIYNLWKRLDQKFREQLIGCCVFNMAIDPSTGLLHEEKEGGGIRMVKLPEWLKIERLWPHVEKKIGDLGWKIHVQSFEPRSSLKKVTAVKCGHDFIIDVDCMPELDGKLVCSLLIMEAEKTMKSAS